MPDAAYIYNWLMDFMYAGDNYRGAYGAAFRYRNSKAIKYIAVPAAALYRIGDVLEAHQQRLPSLPQHVFTEKVPTTALNDRMTDILQKHLAETQPGWSYQQAPAREYHECGYDYIAMGGEQIAIIKAGDSNNNTVFVLHDLASSASSMQTLITYLANDYYIICPDLPGHGESTECINDNFSLSKAINILSELLTALGLKQCQLFSVGAGCIFIPALITNNPHVNIKAGMHNPPLLDEKARNTLKGNFTVPVKPDNYGAFLTHLWYSLRDGRLFWPWYEPIRENIRRHTPDLSAETIHQSLFDVLRCGKNYQTIWTAFFDTDVISELNNTSISITLDQTHPCPEDVLSQFPQLISQKTSTNWSEIIEFHFK